MINNPDFLGQLVVIAVIFGAAAVLGIVFLIYNVNENRTTVRLARINEYTELAKVRVECRARMCQAEHRTDVKEEEEEIRKGLVP